ncbi:MAG: hypothetical protein K0S07_1319 [Chlamydiales bacterium]|jgi:tRNA (cytidine/uridine-2'-O-)-methyltransferase|nr:hypothetical protein [Chlamydiales bacterium]
MKIVLFQPEIPQNTGNVVRTCSVTGVGITLVGPLGFSLSDRYLKRAGLDYWQEVEVNVVDDLLAYIEQENAPFYFFSSHAKALYSDQPYEENALLIFGSETKGLPDLFWERYPEHFRAIPMRPGARCLNLATAVGIVTYEALRQQGFSFH